MIIMTMTPGDTGTDQAVCEWGGKTFVAKSRHGAFMALARLLVEAGCSNQPWECRSLDGHRTFYGEHLHRLSRLTMTEGEKGRISFVPYQLFNRDNVISS